MIDKARDKSTPSSGSNGRRRTEALRMASGPNRAPERNDTASSVGTPTIATSTSSRLLTKGRRMNVRGPVKRGVMLDTHALVNRSVCPGILRLPPLTVSAS